MFCGRQLKVNLNEVPCEPEIHMEFHGDIP